MDRSNGDNDLEWAIGISRRILKIVGLWPSNSKDTREVLLSKCCLLFNIIMLIFVLTIPALMALKRVWGDMILIIDNLQHCLPLLITVLKVYIMWSRKEVLVPLINMIVEDWRKAKGEERNVMLKQAKIARTLSICGAIMILMTLVITFGCLCFGITLRQVTNLTDSGKPMLIQSYYLYDVSKSPQLELTLAMQAIGLTIAGMSYTGVDTFLGLLILHVCGQMENLHSRLANLGKNSDFKEALKFNVKDHVRLIRSIQTIDNTFNLMLLGLLFFFGILFCLDGFLIINVVNEGDLSFLQLSWFVIATTCVLMHMCLYCAVGEYLVTQSERIHRATYEYVWYIMEPKAARNLTLILLRASKPLHITAGKTFPMTMSTLCNLLKTSAGYISVLLANKDYH